MIEKRQACIRHPQHRQTQEAADLDRPMRVLDPRQCRGFARRHPSGEMLQPREWQIRQDEPVGAQRLEEGDFLDLLLEALGGLG
jgi:hypothetical protein